MTEPELKELIREVIPWLQHSAEVEQEHVKMFEDYDVQRLEKSKELLRKCKLAVS